MRASGIDDREHTVSLQSMKSETERERFLWLKKCWKNFRDLGPALVINKMTFEVI